jgi:primosomal protein N' (replication factor Y)
MRETAGLLHPSTHSALVDSRKAIVMLNRRGWSNFVTCRSCSHAWKCPNCDVTLVVHRAQRHVACHHCGHREPVPRRCPECGSVSIALHGAGTQRVEEELAAFGRPVLRLDADVPDAGAVLAAFERAPAAILVGTQVVAKGHDFADVDLGVVLDADGTLRFPDFRSEERTFALVTQLAGRAGRGGTGGRVLVQTLDPEAESIVFAAAHDADGFVAAELRRREVLRYPPFGTLIRVVCSAPTAPPALVAASAVKASLDPQAAPALGPAPLFRLRQRDRVQVLV